MPTIGIMSMQRIVNYGSFLQAYALKQIIKKMGYDVQFVDYHIGQPLISKKNKGKIGKVAEILGYNAPFKQKIKYILFKKRFSKQYNRFLGIDDSYNYLPQLDILIIGSDEVFNCIQTNPNVGYSLELFGQNNNAKKLISYAASFGNTTIEKLDLYNKRQEISELLNAFEAISVRDNNSYKIVNQLTKKPIEFHLDPVLAYDYMNECKLIPNIKHEEKYLILYAYAGRISKDEGKYIKTYAQKKGLKVYAIGGIHGCADKFIDCSPFEVLAYFREAEEVITDTFHGTIFSVITKKRFATIVRKSKNGSYGNEEKLTDLLDRLELTRRMCYRIEDIEKILGEDINYDDTDSIIKRERKHTQDFLLEQIS